MVGGCKVNSWQWQFILRFMWVVIDALYDQTGMRTSNIPIHEKLANFQKTIDDEMKRVYRQDWESSLYGPRPKG